MNLKFHNSCSDPFFHHTLSLSPRAPPVPCCSNGHVICNKCKDKVGVLITFNFNITVITTAITTALITFAW